MVKSHRTGWMDCSAEVKLATVHHTTSTRKRMRGQVGTQRRERRTAGRTEQIKETK